MIRREPRGGGFGKWKRPEPYFKITLNPVSRLIYGHKYADLFLCKFITWELYRSEINSLDLNQLNGGEATVSCDEHFQCYQDYSRKNYSAAPGLRNQSTTEPAFENIWKKHHFSETILSFYQMCKIDRLDYVAGAEIPWRYLRAWPVDTEGSG